MKPRYRILHVINRVGGSGGAEHSLLTNLEHFSDPSFEHHVASLFPHQNEPQAEDRIGVVARLWPVCTDPDSTGLLRAAGRLRSLVRRIRPSLIHCSLAEASLASRVVGVWSRVPVVESLVNISHERIRAETAARVTVGKLLTHRIIDKITMRGVARFHALSEAVADSWARTVGISRERMVIVPRAVDPFALEQRAGVGLSRDELLSDLQLPPETRIVLSVGRQEPQKGQRHLIAAMPRIVEAMPHAVLLIAGRTGNATAELRRLVEDLHLERAVQFLGTRDDVPVLLAAADVFAFPSEFEGLGVALLEAMAMGLPVAVTDRPPMTELIVDGVSGRVFDLLDERDVASKVLEILENTDLARAMGQAARQVIISGRFSPEQVARELEDLYMSIVEPGRRP